MTQVHVVTGDSSDVAAKLCRLNLAKSNMLSLATSQGTSGLRGRKNRLSSMPGGGGDFLVSRAGKDGRGAF
jgi:hypothetical protein